MELPKKYKKGEGRSYALGPFPTFELLRHRPQQAAAVYWAESFREKDRLNTLCGELGVPGFESDKALSRLSQKEVCYAAGVFSTYSGRLRESAPHVVLVQPGDMGNLGAIQRTMLAFGLRDLAIVGEGADHWHPRAVRASMGAVFQLEIQRFPDFDSYLAAYGRDRDLFPFLLDGAVVLTPESCPETKRYTLIFGNEASGLPPAFQHVGQGLFIPQSNAVDSLNLAVSAAIGMYLFTQKNGPTRPGS